METIDRSQYYENKDKESTEKNLNEPRKQYILANSMLISISESPGEYDRACYITELRTFSTIVQRQHVDTIGYTRYQNTYGPIDRLLVTGTCNSAGGEYGLQVLVDIKNGEKIPFSDPSSFFYYKGKPIGRENNWLPPFLDTESGIVYSRLYSTTHASQPIAVFNMDGILGVFSLTNGVLIDRVWFERDY